MASRVVLTHPGSAGGHAGGCGDVLKPALRRATTATTYDGPPLPARPPALPECVNDPDWPYAPPAGGMCVIAGRSEGGTAGTDTDPEGRGIGVSPLGA
jgi:hypothetical protein